nr:hypothetical protein [Pedobacter panaciterrae]
MKLFPLLSSLSIKANGPLRIKMNKPAFHKFNGTKDYAGAVGHKYIALTVFDS